MAKRKVSPKLLWFTFRQNNSGGVFTEPAITVCIEAAHTSDAVKKAEDLGLYFDGCDTGRDCSCCGDRWSVPYEEGTEEPTLYGEAVREAVKTKPRWGSWAKKDIPDFLLVYTDGKQEELRYPTEKLVTPKPAKKGKGK